MGVGKPSAIFFPAPARLTIPPHTAKPGTHAMAHEPASQSALARLKAAQARVVATAKADLAKAAAEKPKPKLPPAPKPPNPKTTAAPPATDKARGKGRTAAKEANGGAPTPERLEVLRPSDQLRRMARNPEALAMVSDEDLDAIWNAMLKNAAVAGSNGATDRQSLFKAAGLPFSMAAAKGDKAGGKSGIEVRDRLTSGLARSRSQAAVTVAAEDDEEPQLSAA